MSDPVNSPGQNTAVGSLSLLQGIFPARGLNPGLLHCRQILYQLSHRESPRILEWVAYPFSSISSRPRDRTGVSCITGRFLSYEGSPETDWRQANDQADTGKPAIGFQKGCCFSSQLRESDPISSGLSHLLCFSHSEQGGEKVRTQLCPSLSDGESWQLTLQCSWMIAITYWYSHQHKIWNNFASRKYDSLPY